MKSDVGNKVLLVAVDKASKFLFAFPLPTKEALGVARTLLEGMLTLGLPLYVRSDPGSEFTAEVIRHLCKWLNVTIAYGPADHPRARGTVERLVGWLHETLGELCKTWPRRWDEYVQPALRIHRTTPTALTGEANSLPSYSVTVMSRRRSSNNSPCLLYTSDAADE